MGLLYVVWGCSGESSIFIFPFVPVKSVMARLSQDRLPSVTMRFPKRLIYAK